ncbi:unnamed protein product, partial [Effrenium voratum]
PFDLLTAYLWCDRGPRSQLGFEPPRGPMDESNGRPPLDAMQRSLHDALDQHKAGIERLLQAQQLLILGAAEGFRTVLQDRLQEFQACGVVSTTVVRNLDCEKADSAESGGHVIALATPPADAVPPSPTADALPPSPNSDAVLKRQGNIYKSQLDAKGQLQRAESSKLIKPGAASSLGKLKKELQTEQNDDHRQDVYDRLHRFVRGPFDLVMGLIIMMNAVVMFIQTMDEGAYANRVLAGQEEGEMRLHPFFHVSEFFFMSIYFLELVLRIGVLGLRSFLYDADAEEGIQWPNIFDVVILCIGMMDLFVFRGLSLSGGMIDALPITKMLRLIKVTRALRLFRVVKLFRQLRILTYTILASIGALFWSMVLLLLLNAVGGMMLSQALQSYILDGSQPAEERQWVYDMFGDSARALYTMFEVTHSGCWPNYARPLIAGVSPWFALFFMVYVALIVFAIIRIISAIFLKETLHVASNDAVMVVQERMRERSEFQTKLAEFFLEADVDGSGCVSRDEFQVILKDKNAASFLDSLDLQVSDAHRLFDLLDDGSGQVTYQEFLDGCMRLKGQARSQDVISILHEQTKISRRCLDMQKSMEQLQNLLGQVLVARSETGADAGVTFRRQDTNFYV